MYKLSGSIDERRRTIAAAAHRTINEQGLHGVNLRDIATELGTTVGVIQYYFKSKDELLLYAKDVIIDEMLDRAREAGSGLKGFARLQLICESCLPFGTQAIEQWRVIVAFNGRAIGDVGLTTIQVVRYEKSQIFFRRELVALKRAGDIPKSVNAKLDALGLVSFIEGLGLQMTFGKQPARTALYRQAVARHLKQMFAHPPE
jgi:TetR/AcrR family transcriptional regulator, transcriptional repressor of bet genes